MELEEEERRRWNWNGFSGWRNMRGGGGVGGRGRAAKRADGGEEEDFPNE